MTYVIEGCNGAVSADLRVAVTAMGHQDMVALEEMHARCTRTSLFHRFHGYSDGTAYLHGQLDPGRDIAMLAWAGDCRVGFGVLSADSDGAWHLGVLVEDRVQRRGIGSWLVVALAAEACHRGIERLRAELLVDDALIAEALGRLGPSRSLVDGP